MDIVKVSAMSIKMLDCKDYSFMWWANGYHADKKNLNILTGYYGLHIDVSKACIESLGLIENTRKEEALSNGNYLIERTEGIKISFGYIDDEKVYRATGTRNGTSRLIEQGKFINRIDIPDLIHTDDSGVISSVVDSRVELTAHFQKINIDMNANDSKLNKKQCIFFIDIKSNYYYEINKNIMILKIDRQNYIFKFSNTVEAIKDENELKIFSDIGCLSAEIEVHSPKQQLEIDNSENQVSIEYLQMNSNQKDFLQANYCIEFGWYGIKVLDNDFDMQNKIDRNKYERVRIRIRNKGEKISTIPLLFDKTGTSQSITGVCMQLRYFNDQYPLGVQVQISKNWHQDITGNTHLYQGPWILGHTLLKINPKSEVEIELLVIYAEYDRVFSASHSQLCLIGWGENQLWEQAALGSFGESICYDPDICLERSFIDDIRPLCVKGMEGKEWAWTNNLGGGDFLHIIQNGMKNYIKAVMVDYISYGPCYTEVKYSGYVDNAIKVSIIVSLMRSDDIVRAVHKFKYTITKDFTFDRLAFFQLGADKYNDNVDTHYVLGNLQGIINTGSIDLHNTESDYILTSEEIGQISWGCILGSGLMPNETGASANRAIVVRKYNAVLGGKEYNNPFISIFKTKDQIGNISIELSPPKDIKILKKDDFVECELELLLLPCQKDHYYGPSKYLREQDAESFGTWKMVYNQAVNNDYKVCCKVGKPLVNTHYPIEIRVEIFNDVLADFTIEYGVSYLPIKFTGLFINQRYHLLELYGSTWKETSLEINYQCNFNQDTESYELIYNIYRDINIKSRYKLVIK